MRTDLKLHSNSEALEIEKTQFSFQTSKQFGLVRDSHEKFISVCRCEGLIRQGITVENVAMLYATAIKYQAEELEEFCFRFSLNHMTAVAQTEAFAKLDELTLKDFIIKAAVHGAFKS